MGLFKRRPKTTPDQVNLNAPLDMDLVRRVADLVNAGDADAANRLCETTPHPREHAFAAFRFINLDDSNGAR